MMRSQLLPDISRKLLPFNVYREGASPADILLWEPSGPLDVSGHAIAWATQGPFKHASAVMHSYGMLWQAGYHADGNGQMSRLAGEVRRHPGTISVFRYCDPLTGDWLPIQKRLMVQDAVAKSLNGDYAIRNIGLITLATYASGLGRVPGLASWFRRHVESQSRRRASAICSQDVHRAYRMAVKVVLCPDLDEALVSPNDISRCPNLRYLGTLTWPANWVK